MGPLPETLKGNKYILYFEEDLTKYIDCIPIKDMEAATVAKAFVKRIVCRLSLSDKLITDQGSNFQSQLFKECCKLLKISTTAYHPSLERFIRKKLTTFVLLLKNTIEHGMNSWH